MPGGGLRRLLMTQSNRVTVTVTVTMTVTVTVTMTMTVTVTATFGRQLFMYVCMCVHHHGHDHATFVLSAWCIDAIRQARQEKNNCVLFYIKSV
jgi:hypothetical protein